MNEQELKVSRIDSLGFWERHCYSRSPVQVLGFALPMAGVFLWLGLRSGTGYGPICGWTLGGLAVWILYEYGMHRFVYHGKHPAGSVRGKMASAHIAHHQNPNDLGALNAGPFFVLPLASLLFVALWAVTRSLTAASLLMVGNTVGYFLYELVHYDAHAGSARSGIRAMLRRYHQLHHHASWDTRYGVTTPILDYAFGTVARRRPKASAVFRGATAGRSSPST